MDSLFNKKNCFKEFEDIKSILLYGKVTDVPNPKVSILMPVYKRPDTFKLSLESALNQDYNQPYEIVVVDNYDGEGESPNLKVVKETGAKNIMYYHNEKNLGMLGNWNRCIEMARADYLTYCHDDDILLANCLSRLMELQKVSGKKCILSAMNEIDDNGNIIRTCNYPDSKMGLLIERDHINYTLYDQFLFSRGFGVGCLFNRQCMLEIGGYNNVFYPSADYALQSSYTYYYGCVLNNIPIFNYRIAANESLNQYTKFAEVDKHFRKCMAQKINLPKWWLNRIIKANYNITTLLFAIKWGKESEEKLRNISLSDRIVMNIATMGQRIKMYRLSFKKIIDY